MYIRTIKLEKAGLKAYRNDPLTDDEDDSQDQQSNSFFNGSWSPFNKSNGNVDSDKSTDEENQNFEGGNRSSRDDGNVSQSRRNKRSGKKEGQGIFKQVISSITGSGRNDPSYTNGCVFTELSPEEKKMRIEQLWQKARRYNNKLRLQARLQKMAEQNLREMMIDDINDDDDDESQVVDNQPKIRWYLIDTEKNPCKVWDFTITLLIIYNLIVSPFIFVFPDVYMTPVEGGYERRAGDSTQETLYKIELAIDIIWVFEIVINFVKYSRAHKDFSSISLNYLSGYFIFDFLGTIPCMIFFREEFPYYWFKVFRFAHFFRLTIPLRYFMHWALSKYSKKRQNDLSGFTSLILMVVYTSHLNACVWLFIGKQEDCLTLDATKALNIKKIAEKGNASWNEQTYMNTIYSDAGNIQSDSDCTQSWIFKNSFQPKPYHSQYIFAFYWIFEVITTVGYGDFVGATPLEYIFSIILEFMGLTFFSFLMGSINGIFNTKDNFDDLIEEKLDSLDMWIKKIEKSNKPYHIQPTLYNDIRKYVEQAFLYDFNLVIEEFPFFQQITPKMQTELIQNTRVFRDFEKSFNHFFDECERGFTNELIINMYCRIYSPNRVVISYKSNVKEMYFIRQGLVEVFNNENDDSSIEKNEKGKAKPILYLPKYSYFGDYQILFNLKSNIVFKTLNNIPNEKDGNSGFQDNNLPDIIFMCVEKNMLNKLCDLFPQTAENIKRRALERRKRFMQQKNTSSKKYDADRTKNQIQDQSNQDMNIDKHHCDEEDLNEFYSDEEPESKTGQKEDMKHYLNKLNNRIDVLVEALKEADGMIAKQTDQQTIMEQIKERKANQASGEQTSIAQHFKEKITHN